jgi:hypothetical protein
MASLVYPQGFEARVRDYRLISIPFGPPIGPQIPRLTSGLPRVVAGHLMKEAAN